MVRTRRREQPRVTGRVAVSLLCAASVGCFAAGAAIASKASVEESPVKTFTITGAGNGSLRPGPYAGCNNVNVKSDGFTNLEGLCSYDGRERNGHSGRAVDRGQPMTALLPWPGQPRA